jgi:hypothetical protein
MTFWSSRMLPGQWYVWNSSSVLFVMSLNFFPAFFGVAIYQVLDQ